eukprot:765930-Amphidinium_carterae.1
MPYCTPALHTEPEVIYDTRHHDDISVACSAAQGYDILYTCTLNTQSLQTLRDLPSFVWSVCHLGASSASSE